MGFRLNLGCGSDIKEGYFNVDFNFSDPRVYNIDLSNFPWSWSDNSCEEILMLDFLEHFSYKMTDKILSEAWRVLSPGGYVDIQVPDFEHCSLAAMEMGHYLCNVCGASSKDFTTISEVKCCPACMTTSYDVSMAAIMRLYGGQDRLGNWHYTAFTKELLYEKLKRTGFVRMELLEKWHQHKNWNFKTRAFKPLPDEMW